MWVGVVGRADNWDVGLGEGEGLITVAERVVKVRALRGFEFDALRLSLESLEFLLIFSFSLLFYLSGSSVLT